MKTISHLPIIDPGSVYIFNDILTYYGRRDRCSLVNNPIIQSLNSGTKNRVIASLLSPNEEILKLHANVIHCSIIKDCIAYVIGLYKKIIDICDPNDILFVAVLRSGLFPAILLRNIINKLHNTKVEIVGITPNYINHIYTNKFKNLVFRNDKSFFFIDGWCSTGLTYNIIKKMWYSLFPKKEFYYAVISNISPIEDNELLHETTKDVLLPWSICQTDYIGLSNYFLNPFTNLSTAFYLPETARKIKETGRIYGEIINEMLTTQEGKCLDNNEEYYDKNKENADFIKNSSDIKIGINECIKALDKNDVLKIMVDKNIDKLYLRIFKEYAKIYKIKIERVNELDKSSCLIIRRDN